MHEIPCAAIIKIMKIFKNPMTNRCLSAMLPSNQKTYHWMHEVRYETVSKINGFCLNSNHKKCITKIPLSKQTKIKSLDV